MASLFIARTQGLELIRNKRNVQIKIENVLESGVMTLAPYTNTF